MSWIGNFSLPFIFTKPPLPKLHSCDHFTFYFATPTAQNYPLPIFLCPRNTIGKHSAQSVMNYVVQYCLLP